MNEIANFVNEYIKNNGIKKTFIAEKMSVTQPYFYSLINKKQFTIEDANRILNTIGKELVVTYQIKDIEESGE